MTIVIDGTLGVRSVNGSAAAPSVTGTDTDTGIVYGTNTLSLATGGTTAVTVDSSQNLVVGANSAGAAGFSLAPNLNVSFGEGTAGTAYVNIFRQASSADSVLGNGVKYSPNANAFASSVASAWARSAVTAGYGAIKFYTAAEATVAIGTDTTLSERMRIDSAGRLQVGTTTSKYSSLVTLVKGSNSYNITSSVSGTSSSGHIVFENNDANAVGSIFTATSSTSFNTTSDYRLKENVTPMVGALTKVASLRPVTYTWKVDGSDGEGFIAHELAEVFPQAVTGEKDAVEIVEVKDEEGNVIGTEEKPVYQGIDVSFLVGTLTAAIQEQQAIIEQLRADVEILKGNV